VTDAPIDAFHYAGRDLEAMSHAPNYRDWIRSIFRPYLHGDLAEVGAGDGSFSRLLAETNPASLNLFEPSADMYALQGQRLSGLPGVVRHQGTFTELADGFVDRFDAMVYCNVLEHIEDDAGELALAMRGLRPGGHLCVLVPALPALMSDFDRSIGHFRRYRKPELRTKLEAAGYRVRLLRHLDLPGIVPWLLFVKWGRRSLDPASVALYDRVGIPLVRRLESAVTPPIGKNLIAVAQKPT
jgi:SAM-dependent methyltransferase